MKIQLFYILLILLILFVSCSIPHCNVYSFLDEDIQWIQNVKEKGIYILENHDTVYIENVEVENKKNISIYDLKSCNWLEGQHDYYAYVKICFKLIHKNEAWNGYIILQRTNISNVNNLNFSLGGLYAIQIPIDRNFYSIEIIDRLNARQGKDQCLLGIRKVIITEHEFLKYIEYY